MKLLLLGATGRTGKQILQQAIDNHYHVNCLVRKLPNTVPAPGVTFFKGNPHHAPDLVNAMAGCEAIISTLNISRTSDFPWAKLRTPEHFLSETITQVIRLAGENNIKRIVVCSAWGVGETRKEIPAWFSWVIQNSNIRPAYEDHERQEALLKQSSLDWTLVRPTGLTNEATTGY